MKIELYITDKNVSKKDSVKLVADGIPIFEFVADGNLTRHIQDSYSNMWDKSVDIDSLLIGYSMGIRQGLSTSLGSLTAWIREGDDEVWTCQKM